MNHLRPRIGIVLAVVAPAACNVYSSDLFSDGGESIIDTGGAGGRAGGPWGAAGRYGSGSTSSAPASTGTPPSSASGGSKSPGGSAGGGSGARSAGGTSGNNFVRGQGGSGGNTGVPLGGLSGSGASVSVTGAPATAGGHKGSGGAGANGGVPTAGAGAGTTTSGGGGASGSPAGGKGGSAGAGAAGTGNSGAGGTPGPAIELVDDCEGGDNLIREANGRNGYWYTYHDDSAGKITPDTQDVTQTVQLIPEPIVNGPAPLAGSTRAVHVISDSNFVTWGAGFGFNLHQSNGLRVAYDLSAYGGIAFWARAEENVSLRLEFLTEGTQSGACEIPEEGKEASRCGDSFGAPLDLTSEWKHFEFAFDAKVLKQLGWGLVISPPDFNRTLAVQFKAGAGRAFNAWVDHVELVPKK